MSNFKLLSFLVFCSFLGGTVFAADFFVDAEESDTIYGNGVHAFFDSDYEEAVNILSKAEEIKNNDPRSYYFLGLAYLRQKKTEQADQYFKKAAQMEYSGRSLRDYAISESLRRIQGEERLRIEKIRTEERTNARIREQRTQEIRYGQENAAARDALRQAMVQNQKDNSTISQQTGDDFDDNAFNVKPIDPINTQSDAIVVRRTDANPFGGVEITNTEPEVAPTVPRTRETVVVQPGRRFVNPDIPTAQQNTMTEYRPAHANGIAVGATTLGMIAPGPIRRMVQAETARQFGGALGTMFSKKPK